MILCYNLTRQLMVDADNCRINTKPSLFFGERPVWELRFLEGEPGSAGTASDLSHIVSYRVAVDTDWNSATEPMCRTVEGIEDELSRIEGEIAAYDARFAAATEYNEEDYKQYDELKKRYDHLMHEWEKASYELELTEGA